jgi:alpha-tubulin suppressor-like RCC1 family protein
MTRAPLLLFASALLGCNHSAAPASASAVVAPSAADPTETKPPARKSRAPNRARVQLALGRTLSCARIDTSVHCWQSETTKPPVAANPRVLGDAIDVAVGWSHACAVTKAGGVLCWGENVQGQLGAGIADEARDTPVAVSGIKDAIALAAGSWHTCALHADGAVSCWGRNLEGQTGSDVAHTEAANDLVLPNRVAGVEAAKSLVASRDVSCALGGSQTSCWGRFVLEEQMRSANRAGGYQSSAAAVLPSLDEARSISARDETYCGVFGSGSIACWGAGAFSLLTSRPLRRSHPVPVEVDSAIVVATGGYHACSIALRGRGVTCWGLDTNGQLGRGSVEKDYAARAPGPVTGLPRVSSLALGMLASCAISEREELYCWGRLPFTSDGKPRVAATPERIALE